MTTVAVLCDPPRRGLVLPELVESSVLSDAEAVELYESLLKDSVNAVARSGGELLVNYRPDESVDIAGDDAEAEVRGVVAEVLEDLDTVRFERQVGETFSGRAGNTATHLLQTEDAGSVAIVTPESAFLARTDVDSAAMKLRSSEVVLGPATNGRVFFAAFADTIDFEDAYAPPAVETLTDHGLDAGLDVDFLSTKPYLETGSDLANVVVELRARRKAGDVVPPNLAEWVESSDLVVEADDGQLRIRR